MDIFKINGLQMLAYCDANEGHVYVAAPKVNVCVDGRNGIGIVRSGPRGRSNRLNICMEDGGTFYRVMKPSLVDYVWMHHGQHNDEMIIAEYHPV